MSNHRLPLAALAAIVCLALALVVWPALAAPADNPPASAAPAGHVITPGKAILLGAVEGLTEYLPVSSTGHLILASHWMGLSRFEGEPAGPAGGLGRKLVKAEGVDAFEVVIQLGAILAVLGLYARRVGQMVDGLLGRNREGLRLAGLLLVAFLPAAVVGLALHKPIKEYLFNPVSVCVALAVGGAAMILVERWWRRRGRTGPAGIETLAFRGALIIGLAQCLALWPGTSRSMVTILAGLLVGLDMVAAAEFSFLLALPTLGAATLYEGAKEAPRLVQSAGWDGLLLGLLVSAVVAAIAVKGFVRWLTRHGLTPFGVYRILLAGGLLAYFLITG